MKKNHINLGAYIIFCLFMNCNHKQQFNSERTFRIRSLGYITDTVFLRSIMDPILPDGQNINSIGYKKYTRKYLGIEVENFSNDTVYLQGFEFYKYAIDTLLTKSIIVLGSFNQTDNSFDSIIRPDIIKDYYTSDNIIISPHEYKLRLVESDTEIDLTNKKLKLMVRYKTRRNKHFIEKEEITITTNGLNSVP